MSTGRESLSPFDFAGLIPIQHLTYILDTMRETERIYVHFWVQFLSQESFLLLEILIYKKIYSYNINL